MSDSPSSASSWRPDGLSIRRVHGCRVQGLSVGPETRCQHYHGPHDVLAIRFACCGDWHPCHLCHAAQARHDALVWPRDAFDTHALLCGVCGHRLTIRAYLRGNSSCPVCNAAFNPGCKRHRHLYFATGPDASPPMG